MKNDDIQKPPFRSYAEALRAVFEEVLSGYKDEELLKHLRRSIARIFADLIRRRVDKIMRHIELGREVPKELLLQEELRLITPFLQYLREYRVERREKGLVLASFKRDFPAIQSVLLIHLGPFTQFDVAVLPEADAEGLRRRDIIEVVQFD